MLEQASGVSAFLASRAVDNTEAERRRTYGGGQSTG